MQGITISAVQFSSISSEIISFVPTHSHCWCCDSLHGIRCQFCSEISSVSTKNGPIMSCYRFETKAPQRHVVYSEYWTTHFHVGRTSMKWFKLYRVYQLKINCSLFRAADGFLIDCLWVGSDRFDHKKL